MTAQFRAFEKLSEILTVTVSIEGDIKRREKERDAILREISEHNGILETLKQTAIAEAAKVADTILEAQAAAVTEIAEANKLHDEAMEGLVSSVARAEIDFDKKITAGETTLAELRDETAQWQEKLADAQAAYDKLKKAVA